MLVRQRFCSDGQAGFRVRILGRIRVVSAEKELVIMQSYVRSAIGGFTKGVVAFQAS